MRGRISIVAAFALLVCAGPAYAEFPFAPQGADPYDYTDLYHDSADPDPNDLGGEEFKYAASPDPGNAATMNNTALNPDELGGVRGGHLFDRDGTLPTAWQVSTGRPDVTIATLDSGIKWNEYSAMNDLRFKTRINPGEVPTPKNDLGDPGETPNEPGQDCEGADSPYDPATAGLGGDDLNGDGVFNVLDFACDSAVDPDPALGVGPTFPAALGAPFANQPVLDPQDVLIAFSDNTDADGNGYVDDMVGWDFMDDDNDPFDDVQYGHGTGEAEGSTGEANNGSAIGSCPNCMVIHMRVGDSFIADVNRFAAAVTYATDNGALVVQSALGTLNNSSFARDAVEYAYDHGVTTILSAADEAAQHNNQPYLPKAILVNSVTDSVAPPPGRSYLSFNGCTNFNARITLAIPSTSCSSDAVGVGSGMAGVVISAAYNAFQDGALDPVPAASTCRLIGDGPDPGTTADPGGDRCVITPNEVRQLMASGTRSDHTNPLSSFPDDVNFASPPGRPPELACGAAPAPPPGCTAPNFVQPQVDANRPAGFGPINNGNPGTSYPARYGHDQFYGYGRVNVNRSVRTLLATPDPPAAFDSLVPPEVEVESPEWNQQIDPARASFDVMGEVYARGAAYTCRVFVAPGHYPHDALATGAPGGGDFEEVEVAAGAGACDGSSRNTPASGKLAEISVAALKAQFPAGTNFTGPQPPASPATNNGRPNNDPNGFVVKVVATRTVGAGADAVTLTGEDRRAAYLHRDQDLLSGFPKAIQRDGAIAGPGSAPTADGESSPAFADLDGDNRNELIFADDNGFVHALRPDGTELNLPGPGSWPVRGDTPGFIANHTASKAFQGPNAISTNRGGAILSAVAIGDRDRNGAPEVYVADFEGKVYGWDARGQQIFEEETNPAFSGKPLPGAPFDNVRYPDEPGDDPGQAAFRRTQHGFISSPVLADVDGNDGGKVEIVAAAMDRHVYAWDLGDGAIADPTPTESTGSGAAQLGGFPVLVVDPEKVASIDNTTHAVTFKADAGSLQQGAIVDTPAVGDLDGDANADGDDERPEIVVGTNEEYRASQDDGFNAAPANGASFNLLTQLQTAVDAFKDECGDPCDPVPGVPLEPGNTRLYAINADGDPDAPLTGASPYRAGWPAKLAIAITGLLPVVGEGVTGNPIIGSVICNGPAEPRIGAVANNGPAYVLNDDGASCYGRAGGRDIPLQSDFGPSATQVDHPVLPAVGHPAFANLGGPSPSFAMPAAGILRALDLGFPDYQGGQDFVGAWTIEGGGQFRPGFPAPVNDLQFLTGPSAANVDAVPGDELLAGTASKDLVAFNTAGTTSAIVPGWPKLTTDWTVANPLIGSFGTLDVDSSARNVVIGMTRSGYIHAYETDAPPCPLGSWPRFHHDNANSGDYSRDAVLPGRPYDASVSGTTINFKAPGDDLLCGTAARYQVVTSPNQIDETNFDKATPLPGPPAPAAPGTAQSYPNVTAAQRFIAIRAVDDQGNVGRPAVVDYRGAPGAGAGGSGGGGSGGDGGGYAEDCSNAIAGTPDKDKLKGTRGGDRIRGRGGDDRLKGRGGADCVSGQSGEDRVSGGAGADHLKGGRGKDRLRGGAGDDVIRARRGARDRINCGPGDDKVFANRRRDRIAKNCEKVRYS